MLHTESLLTADDHDPLPLTRERVAGLLVSYLTLNWHLPSAVLPEAHCHEHAVRSIRAYMEPRMSQTTLGPDGITWVPRSKSGSPAERKAWREDLRFIQNTLGTALGLDLHGCTAHDGSPRDWFGHPTFQRAMPLIAYAYLVMPNPHDVDWLTYFFGYGLQIGFVDTEKLLRDLRNQFSYHDLVQLAERGRLQFNAMHVEESPAQHPGGLSSLAQVAVGYRPVELFGESGLVGEYPTHKGPTKH